MSEHPMQEVVLVDGVARFRANPIVCYLLDNGGIDMNHLATRLVFSNEDRRQFAQLIGYSVSGYGDLSYVTDRSCATAEARAKKLEQR